MPAKRLSMRKIKDVLRLCRGEGRDFAVCARGHTLIITRLQTS